MTFTVIDWIFAGVILLFALAGVIKGFIDNIFGKLAWILGIILACLFYDEGAVYLLPFIKNQTLTNVLSFLAVFIIVFIIIKLIQIFISKIFEWSILKSLDRTLGFFFGAAEGLAVVGLFIFLIHAQPFFDVSRIFDGSFFAGLIGTIVTNVSPKEFSSHV